MEVQLTDDQRTRLSRMASEQGRDEQALVREAIDQFLTFEDWFSHRVDEGVAAAENGELIAHEDVRRLIEGRYPA